MATRVSDTNVVKELTKLQEHKLYNFKLLLGNDYSKDKLQELMENQVDYHELENLLNKNCPKDLALKILL